MFILDVVLLEYLLWIPMTAQTIHDQISLSETIGIANQGSVV